MTIDHLTAHRTGQTWAPAYAREAAVPLWTPVAPFSSGSADSPRDGRRFASSFLVPAFIILFQAIMIWLLVASL